MSCDICKRDHWCDDPGHTVVECEAIISRLRTDLAEAVRLLDLARDSVAHEVQQADRVAIQSAKKESYSHVREQRDAATARAEKLAGLLRDALPDVAWVAIQTRNRGRVDRITAALSERVEVES